MGLPLGGFPNLAGGATWVFDGISGLADRVGLPENRLYKEWSSTRDPGDWPQAPAGDGRPAMLIPGFLAGDPSLSTMARWLKSGGFKVTKSGVRWNVDCMQPTVEAIEARLETVVEETGQKALLVGQSRGGAIGRVIAVRRPDLVDTLVTLGSPLRDQIDVHPRVWFSIGLIGGLGSLGLPGFLSYTCAAGDCCRDTRLAFGRPFPSEVRFISFYSRGDNIVKFQACLDGAAEQVEIESTHLGMGLDSEVWQRMAAHLTAQAA